MTLTRSELMPARIERAVDALAAEIRKAFANSFQSRESSDQRFIRLQVSVPQIDLLPWLAAQSGPVKTFWSGRERRVRLAAVGAAQTISCSNGNRPSELLGGIVTALKSEDADLKYFGGFCFDHNRSADSDAGQWNSFGCLRFIVPRFELHATTDLSGGESLLVCNINRLDDINRQDEIIEQLFALEFSDISSTPDLPHVTGRTDFPQMSDWQRMTESALECFERETLEKVVLARRTRFDMTSRPDPVALLCQLEKISTGCFHFLFQPDNSVAFIGASPERLYRRHGRRIETEAVAGTRPRGRNEQEDTRLENELLSCDKDRREHLIVVESIKETLSSLCDSFQNGGKRSLLKLAGVQHLLSGFDGKLKEEINDRDLLMRLHPSPAVGGFPTEVALQKIAQLEPFNRGWYAAPVGWIGRESSEFAVAIRSGLIHDSCLEVYSGAGLLDGSTAVGEWDEIENKIAGFVRVLSSK